MTNLLYLIGALLGGLTGVFGPEWLISGADVVSQLIVKLLKLVSLPIIFLSVVSTLSGIENYREVRPLLRKVVKYTCLTTLIAASVALALFVGINPVTDQAPMAAEVAATGSVAGYLDNLMAIVPSSILEPFLDNNVMGVMLLALLLSGAIISLPNEQKAPLHQLFSSLFAAVMKVTWFILRMMPVGVWAFVTLFVTEIASGKLEWHSLVLYLLCVVLANLIQAFIVLPLMLKWKGISPLATAKAMLPALTVAFFSKSSSAALPVAMRTAEEGAGVSKTVSRFSFPLCTTINMNACAGFILITVLFVSMSHGMTYTVPGMLSWILIATVAAIGNAGVPMGCYFMASAFLATMGVPLSILGAILPFYAMLDMLESAINVWSDSVVAVIVDHELQEATVTEPQAQPEAKLGVA